MTLTGAWESVEQVSGFLTHIQEALNEVSPGLSVISDIRELQECSLEVQDIHVQAQKLAVAAGLHQLAEIHKLNDPVSELAKAVANESNINLNIFQTPEEAEAWLDEL